ncbi:nucleotidyltransferase [Fulvitalea axinellae]|uniref:Nucleotidyltransferase n=1 Tax=Fulvitalea axinellae TaxID=1182444 RepID=A0AAU9CW47_9BACT|nr:nucleotidyltransferase [Fulvitalea axinellae]
MKPTLLILAAGMGSRYGSLKQIDQFGPSGETIIDYSIYDAIEAGFGKLVFVIRKNIEQEFRDVFVDKFAGRIDIEYAFQELDIVPEGIDVPDTRKKPWGTGHAVMVAAEKIQEPFAVINADDFYGGASFRLIADYLKTLDPNDISKQCMVGYKLSNTLSENGYVSRGICDTDTEGNLTGVTERTHITVEEGVIAYSEGDVKVKLKGEEVTSMNMFGLTPAAFPEFERMFSDFIESNIEQPKAEFYLPSVVNELVKNGSSQVKVLDTDDKWFGVTYREDKLVAIERIKELVAKNVYPSNLWKS